MKISFQQMVNQIKNENISNSEDATNRLIIQKIQMKVLPIKTMTVTIITKSIQKLKILLNVGF